MLCKGPKSIFLGLSSQSMSQIYKEIPTMAQN